MPRDVLDPCQTGRGGSARVEYIPRHPNRVYRTALFQATENRYLDAVRLDVARFRNAKTVCAYAGLAPVVRQSGGKKSKDLGISKQGSGLLRWALVEASWRTVRHSTKWKRIYERIAMRSGGKRAIVAVARKL